MHFHISSSGIVFIHIFRTSIPLTVQSDMLKQRVFQHSRASFSHGSSGSSRVGADPGTVLIEARCQRSVPSPSLTVRWIIRLARGQRLLALRSGTGDRRRSRKEKALGDTWSHTVPHLHTAEISITKQKEVKRNPLRNPLI